MPGAIGYHAVKRALAAGLAARAGLQGVVVSYAAPDKIPEIRGRNRSWENIHFDDAAGTVDNEVFCGAHLVYDADYIQTTKLQVLRPTSRGTQEACDERLEELILELWAYLADQSSWDLDAMGLATFDNLIVTPATFAFDTGLLAPAGHAAGVEIGLRVQTRRSP